jgi:pimeloyl-ACP methyl ester carboxylesterase
MSVARPIVLCLPAGMALFDPEPEQTAKRDVRLIEALDGNSAGVVGWSSGGWAALAVAAQQPDLVERLVLVSTPFPDDEPDGVDLDDVRAKTLLLFGSGDPQTGSRHGRRWQRRLPNARLEMVPGAGNELFVPMWSRILFHLAPRTTR